MLKAPSACRAAAAQAVFAQRRCQQLQHILQDICSLSNMLVPLSSSLSALLSALDSEKMCRGQTTAGAEDLTLKRETAAGLFAYRGWQSNYGTALAGVPPESRASDFVRTSSHHCRGLRTTWTLRSLDEIRLLIRGSLTLNRKMC